MIGRASAFSFSLFFCFFCKSKEGAEGRGDEEEGGEWRETKREKERESAAIMYSLLLL
jgi:hypothetical protein